MVVTQVVLDEQLDGLTDELVGIITEGGSAFGIGARDEASRSDDQDRVWRELEELLEELLRIGGRRWHGQVELSTAGLGLVPGATDALDDRGAILKHPRGAHAMVGRLDHRVRPLRIG